MTVFDTATRSLFGDRNMARPATWWGAFGATATVRVILSEPDTVTEFGAARLMSSTATMQVPLADLPALAIGDSLHIGDKVYRVSTEPQRDVHRMILSADLTIED